MSRSCQYPSTKNVDRSERGEQHCLLRGRVSILDPWSSRVSTVTVPSETWQCLFRVPGYRLSHRLPLNNLYSDRCWGLNLGISACQTRALSGTNEGPFVPGVSKRKALTHVWHVSPQVNGM